MNGIIRDLRYAFRLLRKAKGFALVAILTLAIGIAANTAVFSIVNGALLRPLPFRDPDRLVEVLDQSLRDRGQNKLFANYADFRGYKQHTRSFEELAAATWAVKPAILLGRGAARSVLAIPASGSFFELLGRKPALGRTFTKADENRGCSVVLPHAFWVAEFASDASIVGASINLDHNSCSVLGVMPESFAFYPHAAELWTIIAPDWPDLDNLLVVTFGRLRRGVRIDQAQAELMAVHAGRRAADHERDFGPATENLQDGLTWLAGRNLRSTLWVLFGAVALVLTIACVNVASLLLSRSFGRSRELAVRAALGSGRGRLFRQLLTEGAVLAVLGGIAGVWLAFGAVHYFRSVNPVEMPVGAEISVHGPVLAFAVLACALTALVAGLAPAWSASRTDVSEALKAGGRGSVGPGRQTLARILVMAEMALSVMLLAGAGLLMESVLRMSSADLGFAPDRLLSAGITLPEDRYRDRVARLRFFDELVRRAASLPGVRSVALTTVLPPAAGGQTSLQIFGHPNTSEARRLDIVQEAIDPAYFQTMGTRMIGGRHFDVRDGKDADNVAIIDEALASRYFPGINPIGQRVRTDTKDPWLRIVGVASTEMRTTVYREMGWAEMPTVFRPIAQTAPFLARLVVRTSSEELPLGEPLQRVVASLDGQVSIGKPQWMRHTLDTSLAYPRFRAIVLSGFAGFALLLAAIGLHGVLSQLVSQRTSEIGLRMALGARPSDVAQFVARQGGTPILAGLIGGLVGIVALSRYLTSMLYGIRPQDPWTLVGVGLILAAVGGLAIALPARRAARTDPLAALRAD